MSIAFVCPNCSSRLPVALRIPGAEIDCPRCGTCVPVPKQSSEPIPAPLLSGPVGAIANTPEQPPVSPLLPTDKNGTSADRIVGLKCPSCGGNLDIAPDMDTFACGYCGTRQVVQRRGGTVCLKPIGEAIARVQVGTDRTAAELAVRRLRGDLVAIEQEWQEFLDRAADKKKAAPGYLPVGCLVWVGFAVVNGLWSDGYTIAAAFAVLVSAGLCRLAILRVVKGDRERHTRYAEARRDYRAKRAEIESEIEEHMAVLRRR
jgi:DNA-directed RNA polymerase subunit RPC12/RpoP